MQNLCLDPEFGRDPFILYIFWFDNYHLVINEKSLKVLSFRDFILFSLHVVPPGIEPGTQGFSVLCSTNWAMAPCVIAGAKIDIFFNTAISASIFCKKFSRFFAYLIFWFTFVPAIDRNVAQLVAHYVRDVGVGRSSRLIPTENGKQWKLLVVFYLRKPL